MSQFFSSFRKKLKNTSLIPHFSLLEFQNYVSNCAQILKYSSISCQILPVQPFQFYSSLYSFSVQTSLICVNCFISLNEFYQKQTKLIFQWNSWDLHKVFQTVKDQPLSNKTFPAVEALVCKYKAHRKPWKHKYLAKQARTPSNSRIKCYLWHEH